MDPISVVLGVALLALGAVGATVTQQGMQRRGRSTIAPLALVPFGVLIGAGAAMIRGWDLWISILVGAIVVPVVGAVGRMIEVRRARRQRHR